MSTIYQIKELGNSFRLDELKIALKDYPSVQFIDGKVNSTLPVLYLFYAQSENDQNVQEDDLSSFEHYLQILPVIRDVKECGKQHHHRSQFLWLLRNGR